MAQKNRGFAANFTADLMNIEPAQADRDTARPSGILTSRNNRIADLASGAIITRTNELIDPSRCKMWERHNRAYDELSFERCRDLIESLKAQGKQEVPAIVRRLPKGGDYDFEVIAGARRHWAITWLRANNYPDFRYLIEIRDLTDEEAFRVSDLENRAREDLTDYERAVDYLRALELFYNNSQIRMAERLNVTQSWLSRYLDLARLPKEIVGAFDSPLDLKIKHVTQIKPLLKPDDRKARVLRAATEIANRNNNARVGEGVRPAAAVVKLLQAGSLAPKRSGLSDKPRNAAIHETVMSASGKPVLTITKGRRGTGAVLTLLPSGGANVEEALNAIKSVLESHWPSG